MSGIGLVAGRGGGTAPPLVKQDADPHVRPPLAARPGLASVSRRGGDGVAHVARLLHRALSDLCGEPPYAVDVNPAAAHHVTLLERASFAGRLLAAQAAGRVDWVVFSHLALARAQRAIPHAFRRPSAVFLHGVEAWDPELGRDRLAALRGAAVLLSNSHYTAERVGRTFPELAPIVPCQLALLPPEVSHGVASGDAALLEQVGPRSAIIVGRMSAGERYKGHDELLEAWPAVRAQVPDAQLVMVGDGDDAGRLRAKARALGLGECVLFTGRVSDATLGGLYERTALFAMPSRGEGFGVV